ncbi:MAG TPA: hypothetical protein VL588_11420 [Bdellovibrionota bacterium]|nr:hypothetical protein [Bdellovibrionota bacterium]
MTFETAVEIVREFDSDPEKVRARAEAEAKEMGLPSPTPRDWLMDPFPCALPERKTDPAIARHLLNAEDV